ncbi:MAG: hypothetical protein K6G38_04890 [Gammaproteobacteria bacterium]|nr:hypothetical protein [Gammaproteobacteria bacterium]
MKIKKIFLSLILIALCLSLTSCYASKPGSLKQLVGTYELTKYNRHDSDTTEETEADYNMILKNNIVAYLIIKDNGTGYYVYQDYDTDLYAVEVTIKYNYDDEDPDLVKEIIYSAFDSNKSIHTEDKYPGSMNETLGLNFKLFSKTLNNTYYAVFGRDYSQSVSYKKVSSKSDLSYASKKLDCNLTDVLIEVPTE